jgi:hypothetical protein
MIWPPTIPVAPITALLMKTAQDQCEVQCQDQRTSLRGAP